MTPRTLLLRASREMKGSGIPDPENDAALLLSHLTGRMPLDLRADMDTQVPAETLDAFGTLLSRRLNREPLQYILGSVPFQDTEFRVDSRVLIPRPETSLLVDWALEQLASIPSPSVLDLCCGSGCIGLSIRRKRPDASVTLTDFSPEALTVARINADQTGMETEILEGDLFSSVPGRRFDLIVSNPPYIPSRDCPTLQPEVLYEPQIALDGGEDGLDFYRRIASDGPGHLNAGGLLMMELGADESGPVRTLLLAGGAGSVEIRKDFSGLDRMILATY